MSRSWPIFLTYQENLLSVENDGALDPMGSRIKFIIDLLKNYINFNRYLYIGTGNPWARQSRAKLCPTDLINHANLSSVENVGDLEPTGSEIWNDKLYECSPHLNNGTGNPCAGQVSA